MNIDFFEQNFESEDILKGEALMEVGESWEFQQNDDNKWMLNSTNAESSFHTAATIHNKTLTKWTCDCKEASRGINCQHLFVLLGQIRSALSQSRTQPKASKKSQLKRLGFRQIEQELHTEELWPFIRWYSAKDRRFKALFQAFAYPKMDEVREEHFQSLLNSICPPITKKAEKYSASQIRLLIQTIDWLINELKDALVEKKYKLCLDILGINLFKLHAVRSYADSKYNKDIDPCIIEHYEWIEATLQKPIPPEVKKSLISKILELSRRSTYSIVDPKYNAFNLAYELSNEKSEVTTLMDILKEMRPKMLNGHEDKLDFLFLYGKIAHLESETETWHEKLDEFALSSEAHLNIARRLSSELDSNKWYSSLEKMIEDERFGPYKMSAIELYLQVIPKEKSTSVNTFWLLQLAAEYQNAKAYRVWKELASKKQQIEDLKALEQHTLPHNSSRIQLALAVLGGQETALENILREGAPFHMFVEVIPLLIEIFDVKAAHISHRYLTALKNQYATSTIELWHNELNEIFLNSGHTSLLHEWIRMTNDAEYVR